MDDRGVLRTGRRLLEEDIAIHVLKVGCIGFAMKPCSLNVSTHFYTSMYFLSIATNSFQHAYDMKSLRDYGVIISRSDHISYESKVNEINFRKVSSF